MGANKKGGGSGSVVLDIDNYIVELLFAGSDTSMTAYKTPYNIKSPCQCFVKASDKVI